MTNKKSRMFDCCKLGSNFSSIIFCRICCCLDLNFEDLDPNFEDLDFNFEDLDLEVATTAKTKKQDMIKIFETR